MQRPARYLCEKCLGEQQLTLHDLILVTADGRPLRCVDPACPGYAYLVSDAKAERFLRHRDRAKPLMRAAYGSRRSR